MKRRVHVTQIIEVGIDETKFTPEFMAEFRHDFFSFYDLREHIEHIGQLHARGVIEQGEFIEGYGLPAEMGISSKSVSCEAEMQPEETA